MGEGSGNIFISYRRKDNGSFAHLLYRELEKAFDRERLFMDVEGHIAPGADFAEVINRHITNCDVLLALIGEGWLDAAHEDGRRRLDQEEDFVRLEIASALEAGKWVIPILVNGATMPGAHDLPPSLHQLARRNAMMVRHERFNDDAQGVVKALKDFFGEGEPVDGGPAAEPPRTGDRQAGPGGARAAANGVLLDDRPFEFIPSTAPSLPRARIKVDKPPITDAPQNILRAWSALEALSPASFKKEAEFAPGEQRKVFGLNRGKLPWEESAPPAPKYKRVMFEVFLGSLELRKATEDLLSVYADSRPERPQNTGHACIASVLVDKDGRPQDDDETLGVSSFAWGLQVALDGDLAKLGEWPDVEPTLKQELRKVLVRRNGRKEILPLDRGAIEDVCRFLVRRLRLEGQELGQPFAVRRIEDANARPELSLLNSFFLNDLSEARSLFAKGQAPEALKRYLGQGRPSRRLNLLANDEGLRDALRPANTPLGRWTGPGRHSLALLQQAAVNGATCETGDNPVFAVNGPPGTGKTTLLRDIIVARIVERAEAMAQFADPADAFSASGLSVWRKGAELTLHRVDQTLRGFEMVVASSNNKAVENVSAELPALDAVAEDAHGLRYFKSISDRVLGRETWGLIAAVLGNSGNRYRFAEAFWRNPDHGLETYLSHAAGSPQVVTSKDDQGNITRRVRPVIEAEKPPQNKQEALRQWNEARAAFATAINASRSNRQERDEVHQALISLPNLEAGLPETMSRVEAAERQLSAFERNERRRPGFFARLFRSQTAKEWAACRKILHRDLDQAFGALGIAGFTGLGPVDPAGWPWRHLEAAQGQMRESQASALRYHSVLDAARAQGKMTIPDSAFWEREPADRQTATLWFDQEAQLVRDRVFETAMALHRAFIAAAAEPVSQNLAVFTETFGTRSLGDKERDGLIEDLWATFFLVVPVVSTAFASVERMFARVGPGGVGWLLIDEAGQATPQAAVGGLLRSKRAIVVGDPLQIEPVVTLSDTLTKEICAQFGVSSQKYNAPAMSAQAIADRASPYCARFRAGSGYREVGAPLLVHRRCHSPMFDISNHIAYGNQMVQAKPPAKSSPLLGPSRWIDVPGGNAEGKWSDAEGQEVLLLLKRLKEAGGKPDLYIVTPFTDVQDALRDAIVKSGILKDWVPNPSKWSFERVGTVHTVQGREAETVILVLGAPAAGQIGARNWAGKTPNLLNVAVTRAKNAVYVVGDRRQWSKAGVFAELHRLIN